MFNKTILVAEDNTDNQELMKAMLELLGYEIDLANDGVEAFEKWKKNRYDLLILDIQMPNMNGYQVAIEIRKLEAGIRHLPILALTAGALSGERNKCLEAGMDDYLTKPMTIDILEKKIADLLNKEL